MCDKLIGCPYEKNCINITAVHPQCPVKAKNLTGDFWFKERYNFTSINL